MRLKLRDCPLRPPCPACGMNMIIKERMPETDGSRSCAYECLRCGHEEVSEPG
jgi:DNA-directed RNA polymerase subunit RPC12/RpoP